MLRAIRIKTYITNIYKSHIGYVENNLYKKQDNRTFNSTNNIYKHINQYATDVFNSYRVDETHNVKKTYHNSNDVFINKHNTINTNGTYNITRNNSLFNITDNNYYTKADFNTSTITNNITRHSQNNYEHNVIKKVHKHIKHIHNFGTEINYHNQKSLNKEQYYNFYHDNFNFRKVENISLTQQTGITNSITETNNQTITYVGDTYLNHGKIATVIFNTLPYLTDNYIWIPETSGNVVPGLGSLLTDLQSKYATINAIQNAINNVNNTINTEIANIQTEINNIEIPNPGTGNASKESHYHTGHTGFMYQRNTINNGNRKHIVLQSRYFTFQRQYNTNHLDLHFQFMQLQIEQMQTQIDSLSSGGGGGGGDPDGIGVSWVPY